MAAVVLAPWTTGTKDGESLERVYRLDFKK
jgi:hypothetical protein